VIHAATIVIRRKRGSGLLRKGPCPNRPVVE